MAGFSKASAVQELAEIAAVAATSPCPFMVREATLRHHAKEKIAKMVAAAVALSGGSIVDIQCLTRAKLSFVYFSFPDITCEACAFASALYSAECGHIVLTQRFVLLGQLHI